jgi:hypothetical protein
MVGVMLHHIPPQFDGGSDRRELCFQRNLQPATETYGERR